MAGNLPALASKLAGAKKTQDSYYIFGQPFAQYIRADIDMRYTTKINDVSSIVYRLCRCGDPLWQFTGHTL